MPHSVAALPYTDDVETVPANEAELIAEVLAVMQESMRDSAVRMGRAVRDVHVKSHGCASATFRVLAGLPTELAQGLFAQPAEYPAVMRFSNASPLPQTDLLPDGRGLAIQVQGLSGSYLPSNQTVPTQDFILVNHPTFLCRDVADYLQLQRVRQEVARRGLLAGIGVLTANEENPLRWRWRGALAAAGVATQFPRHPAGYAYYSMTAFLYGDYVAKFRVRPRSLDNLPWLPDAVLNPDAMRRALEHTLRERLLTLDFQVQLRTASHSMPVEDPTREWSEADAPFYSVAEIEIPQQDIATAHPDRGDGFSFDVWHALQAHRPLGGINRVRRAVYPASAKWRTQATIIPVQRGE